jgi:hypothetical protein
VESDRDDDQSAHTIYIVSQDTSGLFCSSTNTAFTFIGVLDKLTIELQEDEDLRQGDGSRRHALCSLLLVGLSLCPDRAWMTVEWSGVK